MNVRKDYGSKELDKLFVYFMKTILRVQKRGWMQIPIDMSFGEPVDGFLKTAVGLMEDAYTPNLFAFVLQVERAHIAAHHTLTKEQITLLVMIETLSMHIRFDETPSEFMLGDIEGLWYNNVPYPGEISAGEYATKTFYPNLPEDVQKKHRLDELLRTVPPDFLRPDDF